MEINKSAALSQEEFLNKASELADIGVENGFDVLVAIRHPFGSMSMIEQKVHNESAPVCYRFAEVASCRTTLIDIALLLRDCFCEVANGNARKDENNIIVKPFKSEREE